MPETDTEATVEGSTEDTGRWGLLGLAGAVSLCCVGLFTLAGGAAVGGGIVAGVTAATGGVGGLRGFVVTGVITALPLLVIGLVLRRRETND